MEAEKPSLQDLLETCAYQDLLIECEKLLASGKGTKDDLQKWWSLKGDALRGLGKQREAISAYSKGTESSDKPIEV